jgi:transposase InsO family protein
VEAAEAAGISDRTAAKWLARWRAEGDAGLRDRSSAPKWIPCRTPRDREQAIEALRRLRMTTAEIAETLSMVLSTVSAVLRRIGLGKLSRLDPIEPPNRYEREPPGELIHVDIKKLGRISVRGAGHRVTGHRKNQFRVGSRRLGATGWEFVHVAVDDATRLAYVEVLGDEKGATAAGFLRRAVAWFGSMGVAAERVMSDNGSCYRSTAHLRTCSELGIRHLLTHPYRPQTNGKAERFIKTLTERSAHGAIYGSSAERTAALPGWLEHWPRELSDASLRSAFQPVGLRGKVVGEPIDMEWCRRISFVNDRLDPLQVLLRDSSNDSFLGPFHINLQNVDLFVAGDDLPEDLINRLRLDIDQGCCGVTRRDVQLEGSITPDRFDSELRHSGAQRDGSFLKLVAILKTMEVPA